jgi:hypothetical protein
MAALDRIAAAGITAERVRDAVSVAGLVLTGAAIGATLAREHKWTGAFIGAGVAVVLPGVIAALTSSSAKAAA